MQANIKGDKAFTIRNRQAKQNFDNSHNDHGDGITSKVHNTVDKKFRQPIFKYLLMADIDCSSIGFKKKEIAVAIPKYKACRFVKSLTSLIVEVKTFFSFLRNLLSSSLLYKNINIKVYRIIILPVLYGCET
jgi:hypothetical protein